MKKHAFIFDMDGVLIDSQPIHYDADIAMMAHFGATVTRQQIEQYAGMTNPMRFPIYQKVFHIAADLEDMLSYRAEIVRKLFLESHAHAIRGSKALLEQIQAAGYPIGLASSTDHALIEWILQTIGLLPYFDVIVSGEEVPQGKPAPDVYLEAARQLDVCAQDCFVVEDSTNGLRAAKAAGMWVLGYQNPTSGKQDLSLADVVTDDFTKVSVKTFLQNNEN